MLGKTFTSMFIQFLAKLKILQTGLRAKDFGFTILWTLLNMIAPIWRLVLSKKTIEDGLKSGKIAEMLPMFYQSIFKQVVLVVQVPIICSVGVLNPDLIKDQSLQMPARPLLWIMCLVEIGFAFVQFMVRIVNSMEVNCGISSYVCSIDINTIVFILQFVLQRIVSITIVGISSRQLITSLETQIVSIQTVSDQINLYRKIKSSLSALLFVGLSTEILGCIVNSFQLIYGQTDKMEGLIQTLFAFSIVFYYCQALNDCFVAFKSHIEVVR